VNVVPKMTHAVVGWNQYVATSIVSTITPNPIRTIALTAPCHTLEQSTDQLGSLHLPRL
jgi:hypothetical protein